MTSILDKIHLKFYPRSGQDISLGYKTIKILQEKLWKQEITKDLQYKNLKFYKLSDYFQK